jgi:hypothetical protein
MNIAIMASNEMVNKAFRFYKEEKSSFLLELIKIKN